MSSAERLPALEAELVAKVADRLDRDLLPTKSPSKS
jgi:hypothetical protein